MGAVMDYVKPTVSNHSIWSESKRPTLLNGKHGQPEARPLCVNQHVGTGTYATVMRLTSDEEISSDSISAVNEKPECWFKKMNFRKFTEFIEDKEKFGSMAWENVHRFIASRSDLFCKNTSKGLMDSKIHKRNIATEVQGQSQTCEFEKYLDKEFQNCNQSTGPYHIGKNLIQALHSFHQQSNYFKLIKMSDTIHNLLHFRTTNMSNILKGSCPYSKYSDVAAANMDMDISHLMLGLNLASDLVSGEQMTVCTLEKNGGPSSNDKESYFLQKKDTEDVGMKDKRKNELENFQDLKNKKFKSCAINGLSACIENGAKINGCRGLVFSKDESLKHVTANVYGKQCGVSRETAETEPDFMLKVHQKETKQGKCTNNDINSVTNVNALCNKRKKSRPSSKKRRRQKQKQKEIVEVPVMCNIEKDTERKNTDEPVHAWNAQGVNHLSRTKRRCKKIKAALCQSVKSAVGFMNSRECSDTVPKMNAHLAFFFGADSDSDSSQASYDSMNDELWESFQVDNDPYNPLNFQTSCHSASMVKSMSSPELSPRTKSAVLKWTLAVSPSKDSCPTPRKVHFAQPEDLVTEHTCITLDEERKGPWEELARDRCRFERRIEETEGAIGYCFQQEHRHNIWQKNHHHG